MSIYILFISWFFFSPFQFSLVLYFLEEAANVSLKIKNSKVTVTNNNNSLLLSTNFPEEYNKKTTTNISQFKYYKIISKLWNGVVLKNWQELIIKKKKKIKKNFAF